ncbi:UDP-N-acetyl-D-glucosamine 6-dehydrogenase [Cupriavidus pauculus]|uniref:UDP-N-acetyl-D-glucosamine 6-dehydrogenase n=1 Tax=Cupriavidus pauculus TaxID=82633 RepID=UPI001EE297D5|nr:UDP-N-acetyl-D-glucosamine 6-dehydrogenase [Cupriavidus pauculus]GJG94619.1 nucleotide sugar dehydrogenase [Cupriavidus pauculus]
MSSPIAKELIERIKNRESIIGIVGLGYVGLPLMLRYCAIGFRVLGIDIDESKVAKLNAGQSYIEHIPASSIGRARETGFEATTDFERASECDAIILCVPTPLNKHREPDMSFVINTADAIKKHLRAGQVVSLESTTYPGTTEEELLPRMQEGGLEVGSNIFLVYSPEREDPGNGKFETRSIPKIVGGQTPVCREVGMALYEVAIDRVVPVSSTKAAEMTKLLENIHRAVNIGLVNEMKIVATRMGIDIFEVVDAASTKPFGFTAYYPGPGLGGHCIPIDPFYLTWKAREYGLHTRFIELSGEVNKAMPEYVVSRLVEGLNQQGKALKGCRVLMLGIAYKKNVDDMRESPSVEIMEQIRARGATIAYSDPHVPVFPKMREHQFDLSSVPLDGETLRDFDAVVLATDHDAFDYLLIRQHAKLLIDSRGKYRASYANVIKA